MKIFTIKLLFIVTCITMFYNYSLSQLSVVNVYDMTTTGGLFTSNLFKTIAVDKFGQVWAGTNGQGLYRFNGTTWEAATSFTTQSFRFITPDPDGGIWVAQSGSTGVSAINGGVDYLDSTYVRTHYGSTDGLVSRYTTTLTRMDNGDVFAVHAPNTTGGVASGGGINLISNSGIVSTIGNGLPTGAFAEDTKCWAIGSDGNSQVWVGVERSCNTSGTCNYGYIAKYNQSGTYLGNFDLSNCLIPFTNSSASVIVRSIHFTNDNKVFVGLFTGGIAVYDLNTTTWQIINETNSLFPVGATVNYQAIYSSGAEVYIGTSAGLLIYNSTGSLTLPSSYQLINTGLPSNNINGISKAANGDLWLATTLGIVKMKSTTISGTVNDTKAIFASQSIIHNTLTNAKVYLRDMTTNLYLDSTITDVLGQFSFSFPTVSNPIKLEVYYTDATPNTFSCFIENVVPSVLNINLSNVLFDDVKDSLPNLTSFPTSADWFWGLLTVQPTYTGYDITSMETTINSLKTLGPLTYEQELEAFTRSIVFEEVMKKYAVDAARMSAYTASATYDLLSSFFSEIFTATKFDGDINVPSLLTDLQKDALAAQTELIVDASVDCIHNSISKLAGYIDDEDLREKVESSLKAVVSLVAIKAKSDGGLSTDFVEDVVAEFVTNIVNSIFSKALFEQYYIKKTQANFTMANSKLNNAEATSNFQIAANNALTNITTSESLTTQADSDMQDLKTTSQVADFLQVTFNAAATISALTGVGLAHAALLKTLGSMSTLVKYGAQASSVALGVYRMYFLKQENNVASNESYIPFLQTLPENIYNPGLLADLNNAVTNYNTQLQIALTHVQNNERIDAMNSMIAVYQLDSILRQEYFLSSSAMLVAAPQYEINTGNGDYLTNEIIIGGIGGNLNLRKSLSYFFSAYVIDSTDLSLVDSILQTGSLVITDGVDLYDSLDYYNTELSNIPVDPYLIDLGLNIGAPFNYNETKTVSAVVKNISQVPINDVYGKIYLQGGFTTIVDSIYVGTIAAGEVYTFNYDLIAPSFDTITHFIIDLGSSNGITEGIGGALMVSGLVGLKELDKNNVTTTSYKLWPNPVSNELHISSEAKIYDIEIYNLQGKKLKSYSSKNSQLLISTENFESGLYIFKGVNDDKTLFQGKFIKK